jgi:hypothetical protein
LKSTEEGDFLKFALNVSNSALRVEYLSMLLRISNSPKYSTRFSLDGMNYLKEGHELYEEIKRGLTFHPAYLLECLGGKALIRV